MSCGSEALNCKMGVQKCEVDGNKAINWFWKETAFN